MKRILFSFQFIFLGFNGIAQLYIDNGVLNILPGGTVSVYGDITSNVDIQGTGLLLLNGNSLQHINMGGKTIPNLELNNLSDATLLNTDARIGNSFVFTSGKLQLSNLNLTLGSTANITGGNSSRFVWTNSTGQLKKELTADIASFELPVGENTNYRPVYLTTTGCGYSSADFGVRVLGIIDPNLPPMSAAFINTYWPIAKTGISGGTIRLEGQYIDPTDVTGLEANLVGYFNNGTDWSSLGESHNVTTNRISATVTSDNGTLSGINKFLQIGAKAFLQGAYDVTNGLMSDNLRTLPFGSSASTLNFPNTDPYRVAPYSSAFTHINNTSVETIISSSVVGAQSNTANNIVDWVFLELRNLITSPGNSVLQTRSALIQRDGDIVDVDGISPVTFNNLPNGNYILAIRHRNHLGLSIDQTFPRTITETKSTAFTTNIIDFSTATEPQLFGTATAFTTTTHPTLGAVNLLWGGNANSNNQSRFSGLNNDRDYLLINSLGNVPSNFINNVYHSADVNMNKSVRFTSLNNDRDFILITVLGNNPSTFRTQTLPN